MTCGFMVIWTLVEIQLTSWHRCWLLLMSSSKRLRTLWHLGVKPLAGRQAAALSPSLTEAPFGEHMADPNSCPR